MNAIIDYLLALLWVFGIVFGSLYLSRRLDWQYSQWMDTRDEVERREAARGPDD